MKDQGSDRVGSARVKPTTKKDNKKQRRQLSLDLTTRASRVTQRAASGLRSSVKIENAAAPTVVKKAGGQTRTSGQSGVTKIQPKVSPAKLSERLPSFLSNVHVVKVCERAILLVEIAMRSSKEKWSEDKIKTEVPRVIARAVQAKRINIRSEKAYAGLLEECNLAADAVVCGHVPELVAVCHEARLEDPALLRLARHGPYQVLVDVLRLYRNPHKRKHALSAAAYFKYLQGVLARKQTKGSVSKNFVPTAAVVKRFKAPRIKVTVEVYETSPRGARAAYSQKVFGVGE